MRPPAADFNFQPGQVTIGYTFLIREYWGGKFNQELKHLMLNHAFRFVDEAIFEIGATNMRSRRAIEKLGAHLMGTEELDGKAHVVYKIARNDFLDSRSGSLRAK